jgi:hypothetical protein
LVERLALAFNWNSTITGLVVGVVVVANIIMGSLLHHAVGEWWQQHKPKSPDNSHIQGNQNG